MSARTPRALALALCSLDPPRHSRRHHRFPLQSTAAARWSKLTPVHPPRSQVIGQLGAALTKEAAVLEEAVSKLDLSSLVFAAQFSVTACVNLAAAAAELDKGAGLVWQACDARASTQLGATWCPRYP